MMRKFFSILLGFSMVLSAFATQAPAQDDVQIKVRFLDDFAWLDDVLDTFTGGSNTTDNVTVTSGSSTSGSVDIHWIIIISPEENVAPGWPDRIFFESLLVPLVTTAFPPLDSATNYWDVFNDIATTVSFDGQESYYLPLPGQTMTELLPGN